MLKILKNLKETWVSVLIIVLLLCVQAWADLTLPDYTSKIVNVGIQQGGIENAAPDAITKLHMDTLLLFTKEDNSILDNYSLVSKNTLNEKDYEKYLKKYPALENEELYVLNDLKETEQENLNNVMAKPLMMLSIITNEEQAETIKGQIIASMQSMREYDVTTIPEGITEQTNSQDSVGADILPNEMAQMTLIDLIKAMPEEQLEVMIKNVEEQLNGMNESILNQAAISAVKEEYKEIGINTDDLQNKYIFLTGLQMLGVALISMVAAVIIMLLSSRVAAKLRKNIKRQSI